MTHCDFLVVGSGPSGSTAAQTLVQGGARVLMLDGGVTDERYTDLIPDRSFFAIRREDPGQHRYLLGDEFESLGPKARVGAQLTPPRRHIVKDVDRFLPIESDSFFPMQSLALGGLGAGWGLGCCVFSARELVKAGLDPNGMRQAYQVVADRIGISGTRDDATPYTFGYLEGIQPSVPLDEPARRLWEGYQKRSRYFNDRGFFLGRPALALLTRALDGRGASPLLDMDFYTNAELAAWRPQVTIAKLLRDDRFQYIPNRLVLRFAEDDSGVAVDVLDMNTQHRERLSCRKLVLACGALGSARIVLRSRERLGALPLLCNEFAYVPCVVPPLIGKASSRGGFSMGQLVLFHDVGMTNDDVAMASIHPYRSLMMFRLLREAPIDLQDGIVLMRALMPALVILALQHPCADVTNKTLRLKRAGNEVGDLLHIDFGLTEEEAGRVKREEDEFVRMARGLGALPLRRVHPGHGSSIHYAGTLPFAEDGAPGTISSDGRLAGTTSVYVADGSGFRYLPAKALTLSLMANAHCVALRLLRPSVGVTA